MVSASRPLYLFDTDVCSYLIRKKSPEILGRFEKLPPDHCSLSSVTVMELLYGCERMPDPLSWKKRIRAFLEPFQIIPYHLNEAEVTAQIRAQLERQGQPIGSFDLMIAGTALSHQLILITNNVREYSRIQDLHWEQWV